MRLSKNKQDKISEQILAHLYHCFPAQPFTSEIARELARDEEFIKKLLFDLKGKGLLVSIRKNSKGVPFTRRIKWRLSKQVYDVYKSKQGKED